MKKGIYLTIITIIKIAAAILTAIATSLGLTNCMS